MSFERRPFVLTEGLHTEGLKKSILDRLGRDGDPFAGPRREQIRFRAERGGDVYAYVTDDLHGTDAYILQETGSDPWRNLAAVCVGAEAMKKNGAETVTAMIPVLRIGRHGAGDAGRIGSLRLAADMMRNSGVDRLVTMTPSAEMLRDYYPVKVCVPDVAGEVARNIARTTAAPPVILASGPDTLPAAEKWASELGWDAGLCWILPKETLSMDVTGRDVLLYMSSLHENTLKVAGNMLERGSGSVNCYIADIRDPEYDGAGIKRLDAAGVKVFTHEKTPAEHAYVIPADVLLADWLIRDRTDREQQTGGDCHGTEQTC